MTENTDQLFLGGGGPQYADPQTLLLRYGNRHGLIAGATGTGKTVTLQILAESFSAAGVPVFMADVKGDLSGIAAAGSHEHKLHEKLVARAQKIGFDDFGYEAFPAVFWDVFGQQGHPIRATITEMGPLLLSRLLELNETQEGVMNVAFAYADDHGLLLLDLKDLRAILNEVADKAAEISTRYGLVSKTSIGAIQRRLLVLENEGAEGFFGEPALRLADMIQCAPDGRGQVNILAADKLMQSPRLYGTFLLWLLSELFEELPEVGDPDKPKFVFFFDEAHLLFDDAPKALLERVEMVARLIRSKGVGVYFITQSPSDVPDDILGQLGNRVQHALRAYTPRDQKAVRAAAETFRPNPRFDAQQAIMEVGVGEALVSTLGKGGVPGVVERTLIRPPASRLGPITPEERAALMARSPLRGVYDEPLDRESAFEILEKQAAQAAEAAAQDADPHDWDDAPTRRGAPEPGAPYGGGYRRDDRAEEREYRSARRYEGHYGEEPDAPRRRAPTKRASSSGNRQTVAEAAMKSFARSLSSSAGRQLVRGILGGLFKSR